jgi:hypothetical protein
MLIWVAAFSGAIAVSAAVFVTVAVLWLRRLRQTVSMTLAETAAHQVRTAQKLGEAVGQLQKQQRAYEQQLHNLAQASLKLRQELTSVTHQLEQADLDAARGDRTVH